MRTPLVCIFAYIRIRSEKCHQTSYSRESGPPALGHMVTLSRFCCREKCHGQADSFPREPGQIYSAFQHVPK